MHMELFQDSDAIKEYNEDWKDSKEWEQFLYDDVFGLRLAREIQMHHAGVTILGGNEPIGSGVLVKGMKGHGILTAGHVCHRVQEAVKKRSIVSFCSQGLREVTQPGDKVSIFVHRLPVMELYSEYQDSTSFPDYGCIVVPEVDARNIKPWATFINITPEGPSRKQKDYDLNHNAWVAAGFLEERSLEPTDVYVWNAFGAPKTIYERDKKRYLFVKAIYCDKNLPEHLGGTSGSGGWEVPIAIQKDQSPDKLHFGSPILRGVVFRQKEKPKDSSDPLAFYAHELETIADDVVSWLDEAWSSANRS